MKDELYSIDGFLFSNQADYDLAKDEWNTIEYIKKNSDLTNEEMVKKLFNKLSEKNTFKTVIGLKFHKELRDILIKSNLYKDEELKNILVPIIIKRNTISEAAPENYKINLKTEISLKNARIINIFLILSIIAMFAINLFG